MWLELLQTQNEGKPRTSSTPKTFEKSLRQPPPSQAVLPLLEATKEPSKAGDQGRGVEMAKGKEANQTKAQPEDKAR